MKIQFFRYKLNFEKYWTEKYWNRKKVMINTNTTISKSIENNQYKYFLKVLKIQIVLMVKGLFMKRLNLINAIFVVTNLVTKAL